jgi:SAM-dependent methyltransferase
MRKKKSPIDDLVERRKSITLDVGCGENKLEGAIGMDVRPMSGVDVVHNLEKYPWPIPDEVCSLVHASHVLEHINPVNTDPKLAGLIDLLLKKKVIKRNEVEREIGEHNVFGNFIRFMDEVWRVTKPGGKFHFVVPYAGSSGFFQDPTHCNPINEATLFYFTPEHPSGLWNIYKPKPWRLEFSTFHPNAFLEVVLIKLIEKEEHEKEAKPIKVEKKRSFKASRSNRKAGK